VLGDAWIVTVDGIMDPDQARSRGSRPELSAAAAPSWYRHVPATVKTAVKDARQWRRGRQFSVDPAGPWRDRQVAFVWQRHELFHQAGLQLGRALRVPSVLFVPATLVWESDQWGTTRPGWRRLVERYGEVPALRGADVVACGTERVADEARRLGVESDRILVTPTGADLDLFARADGTAVRRRLGLDGRFVVGWVGSFRPFHTLDIAVSAAARVEGATLLLVGDGPERAPVEARARRAGIEIVTTGTVPHTDLPAYLGAMDVGLVLAERGQEFHYSPLKLAEYLAAGLPVVVPDVAPIVERLTPEVNAVVIPPGDIDGLAAALVRLRDDPGLRTKLAANARAAAVQWSWDQQVKRVLAAVERT
jgi:glycosyltransferase involved in cell wall biosynthesis